MGGRGARGTKAKNYTDYTPYVYGKITRYEAGSIYRAAKSGEISVKPETTRELYNISDSSQSYRGQYQERYNRDPRYYDRIYAATSAVNNGDFNRAQKLINDWEEENIKRATKKSVWYKYR